MPTLREDDQDDDDAVTTTAADVDTGDDKPDQNQDEPLPDVIEDTRIASSNDDDADDPDTRQRRPRETAAERRARAKAAKDRDKRELDFQRRELERLQRQLTAVTQTQSVNRVADLDNRIATANAEAAQMAQVKAAAITKAQGADAVAAERLQNEAIQRAWAAQAEKDQILQAAQRPTQQAPAFEPLARQFMADNPWYNHNGNDEDSRLVKEIDAQVAKEYVPTSEAYWRELQRRVQKHLPQHFTNIRQQQQEDDVDDDDVGTRTQTRKGPPVGGSTRNSSTTAPSYRLSPERVQALKEAGLWDDPKTRVKMAKKYAEYDKNNRAANQ